METITANGALIISCSTVPQAHTVFDERGRKLGRITKIFGPVSNPYVKVYPEKGAQTLANQTLIGKFVYVGDEHGGQKEKNRRRGNKEVPVLRKHPHS
ncbi:MAG: Gar1/Naf1 family protein [Thermoplasmata archaeon]